LVFLAFSEQSLHILYILIHPILLDRGDTIIPFLPLSVSIMLIKKRNTSMTAGNAKDTFDGSPDRTGDQWPPVGGSTSGGSADDSFSSAHYVSDDDNGDMCLDKKEDEEEDRQQHKHDERPRYYFEDLPRGEERPTYTTPENQQAPPEQVISNEKEEAKEPKVAARPGESGSKNNNNRSSGSSTPSTIAGELLEIGSLAVVGVVGFLVVFAVSVMIGTKDHKKETVQEHSRDTKQAARGCHSTGNAGHCHRHQRRTMSDW
jgi:hypothetical protein